MCLHDACCYFLLDATNGLVKIGFTTDLTQRLRHYSTHNPFPLTLIHVELGGLPREHELHEQFHAYCVRGEWYRFGTDIDAYVKSKEKEGTLEKRLSDLGIMPNEDVSVENIPAPLTSNQDESPMNNSNLSLLKQRLAAYQLAVKENNARQYNKLAREVVEMLLREEIVIGKTERTVQPVKMAPIPTQLAQTKPATPMVGTLPAEVDKTYGVRMTNLHWHFCGQAKFDQWATSGKFIAEGEPYFYLSGNFTPDEVPADVKLKNIAYQNWLKAQSKTAQLSRPIADPNHNSFAMWAEDPKIEVKVIAEGTPKRMP